MVAMTCLSAVSIDAWKSADDNEEGEVLANVLLTAHGDMIVDFHDNGVRMHQPVLDHIRAARRKENKYEQNSYRTSEYQT